MLLGAHLSIAGGLHRVLERAAAHGFATVAMFLRNQRQWRARPLAEEAVAAFRRTRRRLGIAPVLAHGSYLVNLAGDADVREKSLAALREDLARCRRLGIEYLVIHPGSHPDRRTGVELIASALNEVAPPAGGRVRLLLETTAGMGNCIGGSFEDLAAILALLGRPKVFGVCLDTCHVFAAGYDLRTPRAYRATMAAFDRVIGLGRLAAVHVNDSLGPLGSRLDRHEHVGRGRIGARGLACVVRDERLAGVPMILETPKGTDEAGRDWDAVNAAALRRLSRGPVRRAARPPSPDRPN